MCRALLYLGRPVLLDDLLFQPDSALIRQSYMPKMLHMLNLAGFGMRAWAPESHDPGRPFVYASQSLPVFDRNLKNLAEKVRAGCVLAHVRGVAYSTRVDISLQNVHPFQFDGVPWSLAHNGDLAGIADMKRHLAKHVRPEFLPQIRGTTDSEWIYALFVSQLYGAAGVSQLHGAAGVSQLHGAAGVSQLHGAAGGSQLHGAAGGSQLADPSGTATRDEVFGALERALAIIREVRAQLGIRLSSSVNLFLTDGERLAAVRYCFDFGCYRTGDPSQVHEANLSFLSLWYTLGSDYGLHDGEWRMAGGAAQADSILVASEPLSRDTSSWVELPEYGALFAERVAGRPRVTVRLLD